METEFIAELRTPDYERVTASFPIEEDLDLASWMEDSYRDMEIVCEFERKIAHSKERGWRHQDLKLLPGELQKCLDYISKSHPQQSDIIFRALNETTPPRIFWKMISKPSLLNLLTRIAHLDGKYAKTVATLISISVLRYQSLLGVKLTEQLNESLKS
jgi:hypothetical protein